MMMELATCFKCNSFTFHDPLYHSNKFIQCNIKSCKRRSSTWFENRYIVNLNVSNYRERIPSIIHENAIKNEKTNCWIWTNIYMKPLKKYGSIIIKGFHERLMHRISYIVFKGDIPNDLFVCHHCDNPPCVNPDHLFLGTAQDNMRDRDSKNRQRKSNKFYEDKRKKEQIIKYLKLDKYLPTIML